MGLSAIVDSIDALDEGLKAFYKPSGDKFVLDVSDFDSHPAVSGLSKTMREERDARKKTEKALKEFETMTAGLDLEKLKGIDPDKYSEAIANLEKYKADELNRNKKKLKDKEDWEKLEKQLQDEQEKAIEEIKLNHKKEISTFQNKLEEITKAKEDTVSSMLSTLEKQLKDKEIISAVAEANGNIPILMPHISKNVKVLKDDNGEYAARVISEDGTVRINDTGKAMTISEFVNELREKKEFQGEGIFAKDRKQGGSGSNGNQNPGDANEKNPFSKEHFNLTEQGKLLRNNPAEYQRLKKLAGKG